MSDIMPYDLRTYNMQSLIWSQEDKYGYVCKPCTAQRGTCSLSLSFFFLPPCSLCSSWEAWLPSPKPRCVHPQKMLPAGGWGLGRRATLHRHAAGALVAPTATRLAVQMGSIIINCAIGSDRGARLGSLSLVAAPACSSACGVTHPDRHRGGWAYPAGAGRFWCPARAPGSRGTCEGGQTARWFIHLPSGMDATCDPDDSAEASRKKDSQTCGLCSPAPWFRVLPRLFLRNYVRSRHV